MWVYCQDHILGDQETQGSHVRVHFDPRLKSSQRPHSGLLMQILRAGTIEFAEYAEPIVAPFFVAKHGGSRNV